jgi:hypothetical protein
MGYATSNHRTPDKKEMHCFICGTTLKRSRGDEADEICLICRAAILDRVFSARRQIMNNLRLRR